MKKRDKNWVKETARDLIALGSIPFFLLVLIRLWLLNRPAYFNQFLVSGILFLVLFFIFRFRINLYSGLGLVALIFTSLYYLDMRFTVFASVIYVLVVASLFYLKYGTRKIIFGIIAGGVSSLVGYWIFV